MKAVKRLNRIKGSRIKRVRARISGTNERPRLTVFRSNKGVIAQLIDDSKGTTLAYVSSVREKMTGAKTAQALSVGQKIAEAAKKLGISSAVFDRRSYRFHGRVKAVAEGARQAGLTI